MALIGIRDGQFTLDGEPTYRGRRWRDWSLQGLLPNSRMVQGIFDDLNPATRGRWAYADGPFDAERNTREFLAAMPQWRAHGLLSFTLNLQGGSPEGYSREQPWLNSAITPDGRLRPDYLARLARILDRARELGMAPILGLFYFGQEPRLEGEAAIVRAVDAAVDWLLARDDRHVLVEIANECDVGRYVHAIIKPPRAHELVLRVRERSKGRLLVGTSFGGGAIPTDNVVATSDFLLLHGNGVKDPARMRAMVAQTRARPSFHGQPVVFNEDDHYDFEREDNNFVAALSVGASWGFFDWRRQGESLAEGYQSPPVDWGINSRRKRAFFDLLRRMTVAE
jgi:hypothetical protein